MQRRRGNLPRRRLPHRGLPRGAGGDAHREGAEAPASEPASGPPERPALDSLQLQYALDLLRSEQNWVLGVLGGIAAAAVGASLWAALTVASGRLLGVVAIGVGVLVGFAVRTLGRGIDRRFGVAGGALALVGCLLGNLLAVCAILASREGIPLATLLAEIEPMAAAGLLAATFELTDLLFYGIAVYEAYRISFRPLSRDELARLLPG